MSRRFYAIGLERSQGIVFLNPYEVPYSVNETTLAIIAFKNRIILSIGSVVFLHIALFKLQKREKIM
jgi:hypothetical protein